MTGWLIVNEYLNTEKFKELHELFLVAAKKKGITLIKYTNADFIVKIDTGEVLSTAFNGEMPDFVIFYDKDITLARALEGMGLILFNEADAIEICDSKLKTYECVAAYNVSLNSDTSSNETIKMPKTYRVPFTYENIDILENSNFSFLDAIEQELSYPIVIKECYSSFGMGVHLAFDRDEAIKLICKYGNKECLIQEYIGTSDDDSKSKGANLTAMDIRLQMVGNTCVAAMMRSNKDDFRANITNGGVMSKYEPRECDIALASDIMNAIGLDFAGIDIMFDKDGSPVFCEANSNAHFKNLYDLTGINVAEHMLEYIKCSTDMQNYERNYNIR